MVRRGPLDGIVVLELSRFLAGPFCCRLLHDLGARIIKVEEPPYGDPTRGSPPRTPAGISHFFSAMNFGKESIALDLKPGSEDRGTFELLLAKADILVENYRPGVMKRLGYEWESLHRRFPALIMGSISGFGQTGPHASRAALDTVVQAASGLMSITGFPEREPVRAGASISDTIAGMNCALGLQAALIERHRTGAGNRVDISMLDATLSNLLIPTTRYLANGEEQGRLGNTHQAAAPFDVFRCKEGFLCFSASSGAHWKAATAALGRSDLASNPMFRGGAARLKNAQALKREFERTLSARTAVEWEEVLLHTGVPVAPVAEIRDVVRDPQVVHRNMVVELEPGEGADPAAPRARVVGNPIKLSGFADPKTRKAVPKLDEHGEQLRAWAKL